MAKKAKPQRQRREQDRAIKTRESILKAASEVITENGLHNLKSKDIAKKAGIPAALYSYHYPSMESLLNDLVLQELEKIKIISLQALESHPNDPTKALLEYVKAPIVTAKNDKAFQAIVTYFYHMATVEPRFNELNTAIRLIGRERILGLVSLAREQKGELSRYKLGLKDATIAIQGLMTGLFIMPITEKQSPGVYDFNICEKIIAETTSVILFK